MIQEIPQQVRQQLKPKPRSPGFGVEANLDFHVKNFFSQCSNNLSKQGVYMFKLTIEVKFKDYCRLIQAKSLALVMIKSVTGSYGSIVVKSLNLRKKAGIIFIDLFLRIE